MDLNEFLFESIVTKSTQCKANRLSKKTVVRQKLTNPEKLTEQKRGWTIAQPTWGR